MTRLDMMRLNCRLVARVLAQQIFAATLDLGAQLPPPLARARMVCIPILISIVRDMIDREMRHLPAGRGPSINAIASSLDLPFETVRRNVQRLAKHGWVTIAETGGVSLPVPMRVDLADWCIALGRRVRAAAATMEALGATERGSLGSAACDNSCVLAGLDLLLSMAGTSKLFKLRFAELMLVHFVCSASVAHLNARPSGSTPFARIDTVPDTKERAFIALADIAQQLSISRSTVYRIVMEDVGAKVFERRGNSVRASDAFLSSPIYVTALEALAGRAATLFSRVERHRCGMGCTALDHLLRRPRPWPQGPRVQQAGIA